MSDNNNNNNNNESEKEPSEEEENSEEIEKSEVEEEESEEESEEYKYSDGNTTDSDEPKLDSLPTQSLSTDHPCYEEYMKSGEDYESYLIDFDPRTRVPPLRKRNDQVPASSQGPAAADQVAPTQQEASSSSKSRTLSSTGHPKRGRK
ncbi:hypothetical protein FEM48_Zijuj01G0243400 [Ziziphus jujuba var. spinosa]|nr:hypothetical protein FEM48_Zijuj01G0243400 [Ziziphus jujuba var. spinosa]